MLSFISSLVPKVWKMDCISSTNKLAKRLKSLTSFLEKRNIHFFLAIAKHQSFDEISKINSNLCDVM